MSRRGRHRRVLAAERQQQQAAREVRCSLQGPWSLEHCRKQSAAHGRQREKKIVNEPCDGAGDGQKPKLEERSVGPDAACWATRRRPNDGGGDTMQDSQTVQIMEIMDDLRGDFLTQNKDGDLILEAVQGAKDARKMVARKERDVKQLLADLQASIDMLELENGAHGEQKMKELKEKEGVMKGEVDVMQMKLKQLKLELGEEKERLRGIRERTAKIESENQQTSRACGKQISRDKVKLALFEEITHVKWGAGNRGTAHLMNKNQVRPFEVGTGTAAVNKLWDIMWEDHA